MLVYYWGWNNPQLNLSSLQNPSNILSCWPIKKCSNKGLLQCSQNRLVFHTKNHLFTAHLVAGASHQLLLCDTCPFFFPLRLMDEAISQQRHMCSTLRVLWGSCEHWGTMVFSNLLKKNNVILLGVVCFGRFPWFLLQMSNKHYSSKAT